MFAKPSKPAGLDTVECLDTKRPNISWHCPLLLISYYRGFWIVHDTYQVKVNRKMWGWHFLLLDSYISDTCLLLLFFLLDIEPFYYWRKSQNKQRIRGQICQNFRVGNLINCFFKRIARFVWAKERKCDSLIFLANHSVAFLKEQREQITHGCSFVI